MDLAREMLRRSPHFNELQLELLELEPGYCQMRLPYRDVYVGNLDTGVVHGGVITTLLDSVCGIALASLLDRPRPMATLDLRIDYLRPATPAKAIIGEARVDKRTHTIAFLSGRAFHEDDASEIAKANGSFIMDSEQRAPDGEASS